MNTLKVVVSPICLEAKYQSREAISVSENIICIWHTEYGAWATWRILAWFPQSSLQYYFLPPLSLLMCCSFCPRTFPLNGVSSRICPWSSRLGHVSLCKETIVLSLFYFHGPILCGPACFSCPSHNTEGSFCTIISPTPSLVALTAAGN